MTRLLQVLIMALVGAAVMGCSTLSASSGGGPHGQVAVPAAPAPQTAAGSEDDAGGSADALPPYLPVTGLSGAIISIGASTTTNLVARAGVEFRRIYPTATLKMTTGLTSIGPLALREGHADLVPMSRPLTPEEVLDFQRKNGYPPTEIKIAADALAIFVHKGNPLTGLTFQQLDAIFSRTHRRGGTPIDTWGQVGLTGEWVDRPIVLHGYGSGDGVNEIFRRRVLDGGEYRLSLRVEPAGSSIVQAIATDPSAIGCASTFFTSKRVRAVPLAGADGQFYAPTEENVRNHKYPLSRFHYIYVNKPPRQALAGPAAEFLRFLLSREGQATLARDGNIPLDAPTAQESRRRLSRRTDGSRSPGGTPGLTSVSNDRIGALTEPSKARRAERG
jgi:phosphate transport system substrate-binding protein